jgi:hypothetical protein
MNPTTSAPDATPVRVGSVGPVVLEDSTTTADAMPVDVTPEPTTMLARARTDVENVNVTPAPMSPEARVLPYSHAPPPPEPDLSSAHPDGVDGAGEFR